MITKSEVLIDESQQDDDTQKTAGEDFEEVKPLTEELIDTLINLLFYANFTIPRQPHIKQKVTYAIWESGVGCVSTVGTSKEFENNRCEVLRLLLTLASESIYMPASKLNIMFNY